MSPDYSSFNKQDLDQVGSSLKFGTDSLPEPMPVFYVVNGKQEYAESKSTPLFYGGWAVDSQKYATMLQQTQRLPYGLISPAHIIDRQGKSIEILIGRAIIVAPVTSRVSWLSKDNRTRTPDFQEGSRRHVQLMVVVADRAGKDAPNTIWGSAILSAKGFQAKNLLGLVDDWSRHTVDVRTKFAPGIPAYMFYMAVGTFGTKREVEMVGQGQNQSPITPITVFKPEMTEAKLNGLFGGQPLLDEIARLQSISGAWVQSWGTATTAKGTTASDDEPWEKNKPEHVTGDGFEDIPF
jgi:hypothetical protein